MSGFRLGGNLFEIDRVMSPCTAVKHLSQIGQPSFFTFSLLAKKFSGKISWGDLTSRKCFSALLKKNHGCGQALISCMNYKFAKNFLSFIKRGQSIWNRQGYEWSLRKFSIIKVAVNLSMCIKLHFVQLVKIWVKSDNLHFTHFHGVPLWIYS